MKLVELIPNFSDGRNGKIINLLSNCVKSFPDAKLLDTEMDYNHNRSVITVVCTIDSVVELAFNLIKIAAENIDMDIQKGLHPRFGATDIMPLVPLEDTTMDECIKLSREIGMMVGNELKIPVFMYERSATVPERKNLENIRNKSFQIEELRSVIGTGKYIPDYGPSVIGKAGSTIIGARELLIAYNIYLNTDDIKIGRKIASAIRAKDGGFAYVKSLAFKIPGKNVVQISMNIVNYRKNPLYRIFETVKSEAAGYGISIIKSEFIGMVPQEAMAQSFNHYLMSNIENTGILVYRQSKI
ncbi:glutamate formimidoyltransferase [Ferroplasma sp.]|uniref:glutamate formimidoyltransferase n=1 Tax=Ferroplasma sp. TaxID=2591003 RepID=UPI00307E8815